MFMHLELDARHLSCYEFGEDAGFVVTGCVSGYLVLTVLGIGLGLAGSEAVLGEFPKGFVDLDGAYGFP